jgi:hypothetical protein
MSLSLKRKFRWEDSKNKKQKNKKQTTEMKTTIITILFLTTIFGFATDFGAGPDLYARAYERAVQSSYQVYGNGLDNGYSEVTAYNKTVTSSVELMEPFKTAYQLRFANYKEVVYETAEVTDIDGNRLFVSYTSWKPEEVLSDDGNVLSYRMPFYAGRVHLYLADRVIDFDGDAVEVVLDGGWNYFLEIRDGQVVVPGWVYEQKGAFVEWIKGRRIVTDIQTGLPVKPGKEIIEVSGSGVSGITVRETEGLYLSIYSNWDWNTTFEVTMPETGVLKLWMGDWQNYFPQGIWITKVGKGEQPVYLHPNKEGVIYFDVEGGETLHIKQYWPTPTHG